MKTKKIKRNIEVTLKKAKQGDISAMFDVASFYEFESPNKTKSLYWYRKAASHGNPVAKYNLAVTYFNGDWVPKSFKKSFILMRDAAKQKDYEAISDLGYYYFYGIGTKVNYQKAITCYKKASSGGIARASFNIALMYYNGEGVKQNDKIALQYFKKAVTQKHDFVQKYLAFLYLDKNSSVFNKTYGEKIKKKIFKQGLITKSKFEKEFAKLYS